LRSEREIRQNTLRRLSQKPVAPGKGNLANVNSECRAVLGEVRAIPYELGHGFG
jgi:hypothetical protein